MIYNGLHRFSDKNAVKQKELCKFLQSSFKIKNYFGLNVWSVKSGLACV